MCKSRKLEDFFLQVISLLCLHYGRWFVRIVTILYTLSETWSGVNWADLMAAQGAFGTDFYDSSILRPKHRAYYRSGRPRTEYSV